MPVSSEFSQRAWEVDELGETFDSSIPSLIISHLCSMNAILTQGMGIQLAGKKMHGAGRWFLLVFRRYCPKKDNRWATKPQGQMENRNQR